MVDRKGVFGNAFFILAQNEYIMKRLLLFSFLMTSAIKAQTYEVKMKFKHHTEFTDEYLEKHFDHIPDLENRKWNIEQNASPAPIDYVFYSSKNEQNSIEQEKVNNEQGSMGSVKNSVVGLPFGFTYSNFKIGENYQEVDV